MKPQKIYNQEKYQFIIYRKKIEPPHNNKTISKVFFVW